MAQTTNIIILNGFRSTSFNLQLFQKLPKNVDSSQALRGRCFRPIQTLQHPNIPRLDLYEWTCGFGSRAVTHAHTKMVSDPWVDLHRMAEHVVHRDIRLLATPWPHGPMDGCKITRWWLNSLMIYTSCCPPTNYVCCLPYFIWTRLN